MPSLNPDVRALLTELDGLATAAGAEVEFDPSALRAWHRAVHGVLSRPAQLPAVGSVIDGEIVDTAHRVRIRTYQPVGKSLDRAVVMMHGGGWMVGDLDSGDLLARHLTAGLRATVVSVDYRLAPEHPFPAAFEDCRAALRAVRRAHPTAAIGVAGDSAGGNLAAALTLMGRTDPRYAVDAQLLIYPALDPEQTHPSQDRYATGYLLTREVMRYYWTSYLQSSLDRRNARATPLVAADVRGVAPAVVVTAGFDPLQDEGQRYAQMLVAAHSATCYLHEPDLIHGFIDTAGRIPAARRAVLRMIRAFDLLLPAGGSAEPDD